MKININPIWKEKQSLALKELYDLREKLRPIIILLNADYVRGTHKSIYDIQDKITSLYNDLTPIAKYIEIEL